MIRLKLSASVQRRDHNLRARAFGAPALWLATAFMLRGRTQADTNQSDNDWPQTEQTGKLFAMILLVVAVAIAAGRIFHQFPSKLGRSAPGRMARLDLIVALLSMLVSASANPLNASQLMAVFVVAVRWASCAMPRFETLGESPENQLDIGPIEANEFRYVAPR